MSQDEARHPRIDAKKGRYATPHATGGDGGARLLWGVFVAVAAALALRGSGGWGTVGADDADFVRTLIEVKDRVARDYVRDVPQAALRAAAVDGMLALATDVNTAFIPPAQQADFEDRLEGRFAGVGILVDRADNGLRVRWPLPGGPAREAGLLAGDVILAADGKRFDGLDLPAATDLIRGQIGTSVRLTISRDNGTFDADVRRERVASPALVGFGRDATGEPDFLIAPDVPGVGSGEVPRVAYVRLIEFGPDASARVSAALRGLADGGGLDAVILDVRGNPGGRLTEAVAVADLFLPGGRVITWKGGRTVVAPPSVSRDATDDFGRLLQRVPLAVLVDGGSASASEVVAGALADYGRATLVGTPTFGKGSVQSIFPVGGGRLGTLKLTEAYYHLPGGRVVERVAGGRGGVMPHVAVARVPDENATDNLPDVGDDGPPFPRQVWAAYEVVVAQVAAARVSGGGR